MKRLLLISIMFLSVAVFAKESKAQKKTTQKTIDIYSVKGGVECFSINSLRFRNEDSTGVRLYASPEKQHRVTNNSGKSAIQNCADRGHIFDEDSTLFVPKNEAKTKSYIADFEDSTVLITPTPYNIQRVCLRCGKKVIEQTADKREVIWRRPVIVIDAPIVIDGVTYD